MQKQSKSGKEWAIFDNLAKAIRLGYNLATQGA